MGGWSAVGELLADSGARPGPVFDVNSGHSSQHRKRKEANVKKLRCLLGLHNWVVKVNEGERYLACRDCGKYGGSPGSLSGGWGYRE